MIGLIAGGGDLPKIFLRNAKESVITVALTGDADKNIKKCAKKIYWERIGNVNKIINVFKKEKVKKVCMTGKVNKAGAFLGIRPNLRTLRVLLSLKDGKDTTLLTGLINEFEREGIRVVSPLIYLKDLIAKKGILTKRKPAAQEYKDIKFGLKTAKKLADMDIGQTIIVKNRMVLAVEAIEGTDETIKRGGMFGRNNSVCIKVARTKQDLRKDIPGIGTNTIYAMSKAKVSCIAIESGKMLIANQLKVVKLAERLNICVIAI